MIYQNVKPDIQTKLAPGRFGTEGTKTATHQPVDGDDDEDGRIHHGGTTDAPSDPGMSEED